MKYQLQLCLQSPLQSQCCGVLVGLCSNNRLGSTCQLFLSSSEGVGGTEDKQTRPEICRDTSVGIRAVPLAPWPDGGPESLRSLRCGLATHKMQT
ncbi:hypothetical protein PoB_001687800 [Plakobranchus ocellatus]|uniref:Uncharacterized protein n=1 Tax=Plakobranchus ocellatus TaxID=259542 RepID=A0AAV3Z6Z7_9GAST|nr:hypothetical protein PoB_001687800 [Plakobranchus ocellatus]